jgi:acylphosphatase
MASCLTLRVRVTGRVQGVWFRGWTQEQARARGLSGWVRNAPDGSVAALISGPGEKVAEMVAALHDGPPLAQVDRVETHPAEPPDAPGFDVMK